MGKRIGWLVVVLGLANTANASAQPIDESLHKEGVALRREGRNAEALAVFERALALDGSPRTRAQVALAEVALGLWVEAERDLADALAAGHDSWFQDHGEDLKAQLNAIRSHLGSIDVTSNVGSTSIWLNGRPSSDWPSSPKVRVVAGDVEIEARAPGFATQARTIHVAVGEQTRTVFQLVRDADVGRPLASTPAAPNAATWMATSGVASRSRSAELARPAAIASLAGGLGLLAGGSVALAIRDSNAAIYNDDARCFYGGLTRDQRCGGYRTAVSVAGDFAIAQFSVAAAALVASGILFGVASKPRVPVEGETTCAIGIGISCVGRF